MKKKDVIMNNKELRKIFVAHVNRNRAALDEAVKAYDKSWTSVRDHMAESGIEVTPDELKELTELIRACIDAIDNKEL